MLSETTKILKECVNVDTPLDVVVNIAEELYGPLFKPEDLMVFETIVMPFDGFKYYYFSISLDIKKENYTVQSRIDLKYEATPPLFVLHNCFWAEDEKEFFKLIRSTHAYKYIISEGLKPFAVDVHELHI